MATTKGEGDVASYDPVSRLEPECYDELDGAYVDRDYEHWYTDCLETGIEPTLDQLRKAEKRFTEGW